MCAVLVLLGLGLIIASRYEAFDLASLSSAIDSIQSLGIQNKIERLEKVEGLASE